MAEACQQSTHAIAIEAHVRVLGGLKKLQKQPQKGFDTTEIGEGVVVREKSVTECRLRLRSSEGWFSLVVVLVETGKLETGSGPKFNGDML